MRNVSDNGASRALISMALERDEMGQRLGGGLPRGAMVLLEGNEGSGRSVLCQRMAYGGLVNGHRVFYVSTEMNMKEHIDQMYSLGYDLGRHMDGHQYIYISTFGRSGAMLPREQMLPRLRCAERLYEADLLILDSLPMLLPQAPRDEDMRDLLAFYKTLTMRGKTIVITTGGEEQMQPFRQSCDVLLHLSTDDEARAIHHIDIKRYARARSRVGDGISFRVEPGVGTVIDLLEVS